MKKTNIETKKLKNLLKKENLGIIKNNKIILNSYAKLAQIEILLNETNPNIRNSIDIQNLYNLNYIFSKYNFIKQPINIETWKTTKIIQMNYTFSHSIIGNDTKINTWDTQNIRCLKGTFYNISTFNQNIDNWIVKRIEDLTRCFQNIKIWKTTINNWELNKIYYMVKTFKNSNQNLNFKTWLFNKDLQNTIECFKNCKYQKNTFHKWEFNNITEKTGMFENCQKLYPLTNNFFCNPNFIYETNVLKNNNNNYYTLKKHYKDIETLIPKKTIKYEKLYKLEWYKRKHKFKKIK